MYRAKMLRMCLERIPHTLLVLFDLRSLRKFHFSSSANCVRAFSYLSNSFKYKIFIFSYIAHFN